MRYAYILMTKIDGTPKGSSATPAKKKQSSRGFLFRLRRWMCAVALEKRQLLRSSSAAASTKAPLASTSIWEFCSATKMKEESQTSLEPQRRSLDKMKDCWHNFAATVEHCHFGIKGGTKVSIWSALVCREIKGNLKPSFKKSRFSLLIIKRAEWITRYFTLPWIWIIFFWFVIFRIFDLVLQVPSSLDF